MRRALLGLLLAEVLAIWGLVSLIGWGTTLLLLLACIPIGFAVMRSAGAHAFADLQAAGRTGLAAGRGSQHAFRFAAGLLIAVPGPVTTLVGLGLLTPPGRRIAARWVGRRVTVLHAAGFGAAAAGGDVVAGTVVDEPDMRQGPSRHPELGP